MRSFLLLVVLTLGCSRTPKPAEIDASAPPPSPGPKAVEQVEAGGIYVDGAHAYEGVLGAKTVIAMDLVRTGDGIRGSYRYASIGQPLVLEGKADASGALALTESIDGRTTGSLRLHPSGTDLVGEWTDSKGKKSFPVRVSPVRAVTPSIGTPVGEQARKCLEDVGCSASQAAGLFVASDDAREPFAECFRFLDGAGVARDLPRGRACLDRSATEACDGSGLLHRAELASMRIDGIGGPVDIAGARALFATCFDDITKAAVLAHASAKESSPKTPAMAVCKQEVTTLVWEECAARQWEVERARTYLGAKVIAATLDPDGVRLFRAANEAYEGYVRARVLYVFDVYSGGSIRIALATEEEERLERKRADDLTAFATFMAKRPAEADAIRAAKKADAALAAEGSGAALAKTDTTWKAYRDAEIAFYDHVFGATQGHDEVRRALTIKLSTRRVAECPAPPA